MATLPFYDGFEQGALNPAWTWANPTNSANPDWIRPGGRVDVTTQQNAIYDGFYGMRMGRRNDGQFTVNALDLHLDLSAQSNVKLTYWLSDYFENVDADEGDLF